MTARILALLRRREVHLTLAAGVSGLATYIFLAVLARGLGQERYSEFSWFWSLTVIAGLGVFLPIEQETSRIIVGGRGVDDRGRPVLHVAVITGLAVSAAGALVVVFLGRPSTLGMDSDPALVGALVFSFFAYSFQFPTRARFAAAGDLSRYGILLTIESVARVVLAVVVVLLLPTSAVAAAAVVAVAALLSLFARIAEPRRSRSPRIRYRGFVSGMGRLITGGLIVQILLNLPPVLASAQAGAGPTAGQLLIAVSLSRIPIFVYQSVQAVVLPRLAATWTSGDRASFLRVSGTFLGAALITAFGWAVTITAVGPQVTATVFGPEYVTARYDLGLVAGGIAFLTIALAVSDTLLTTGAHSSVAILWLSGLLAAGVLGVVAPRGVELVTYPVLGGAAVASCLGILFLAGRLRVMRMGPGAPADE